MNEILINVSILVVSILLVSWMTVSLIKDHIYHKTEDVIKESLYEPTDDQKMYILTPNKEK